MVRPLFTYAAKLVRVIDGDSLVLDIDLGLRIHTICPVRLAGINAPERNAVGGAEATAHLAGLLGDYPLTVKTLPSPEKYGRWLCVIAATTEKGEVVVNAAMIAGGHAVEYAGGERA